MQLFRFIVKTNSWLEFQFPPTLLSVKGIKLVSNSSFENIKIESTYEDVQKLKVITHVTFRVYFRQLSLWSENRVQLLLAAKLSYKLLCTALHSLPFSHFICLTISPFENYEEFKKYVGDEHPEMVSCLNQKELLHVTVCCLKLNSKMSETYCSEILKKHSENLLVNLNPLISHVSSFDLCGLHSMTEDLEKSSVIYTCPTPSTTLTNLVNALSLDIFNLLSKHGVVNFDLLHKQKALDSSGTGPDVKLHITMMNTKLGGLAK